MAGLFVYGTLRRGERFHAVLVDLAGGEPTRVAAATARGALRPAGDYWAFVPGDEGPVPGEYLEFDALEEALAQLDEFEEYYPDDPARSLYVRELIDVVLEDGSTASAWVYAAARP
jgi:gamma-glutamylcyclotransferase (GGCT)/AIG2-like uncharacterized protein YtfP